MRKVGNQINSSGKASAEKPIVRHYYSINFFLKMNLNLKDMEALLIEDQEKSLTNRWLGLREWLKETRENLSELRECFW